MSGGSDLDSNSASNSNPTPDDPTRVVVTGASGRMGTELLGAASDRDDVTVVGAASRTPEAVSAGDGVAVVSPSELPGLLADTTPDALVEFTGPGAATDHVAAAAEAGVPAVVGTTGFKHGPAAALEEFAAATPVLYASNFARGVAALRRVVRAAATALPDYDVEVTETHHNGKRDAPSGTAITLVEDVEDARDDLDSRVHGRVGEQPRADDEVGVHARRAGDVTGEHEVVLAGNRETLSLTHRAGDRGVFAEGALDAAAWLADREPGWYGFDDVLAENETDSIDGTESRDDTDR
ncbi:MAG: 4-hydroxy-tetrahydrodipicolinate reductase [Halolamina sp.]